MANYKYVTKVLSKNEVNTYRQNKSRYKFNTEYALDDYMYFLSCDFMKKYGFSSNYYTVNDIDLIVAEKDVKTFQSINPVLFDLFYRISFSESFYKFFVKYATEEQLLFCSNKIWRKFDLEYIYGLYKKFGNISTYNYLIYVITDKENTEKIIGFVKNKPVREFLENIKDRNRSAKSLPPKIGDFHFESCEYEQGIPELEIKQYMQMQYYLFYNLRKTNSLNIEKSIMNSKLYDRESFKKYLKSIYVPANNEQIPDNIFDEKGLKTIDEILEGYNLDKYIVHEDIRQGKLAHYRISPRAIRVTEKDFTRYIDSKMKNNELCSPSKVKFIDNETDFISEQAVLSMFYPWYREMSAEKFEINKGCTNIHLYFRHECEIYHNSERVRYFKKQDIIEEMQSHYGCIIRDEKKFIKKDIILDESVLTNVWPKAQLPEYIHQHFPDIKDNAIRNRMIPDINKGIIPCFKFTDRNILIRKDDLLTYINDGNIERHKTRIRK